MSFTGDTFKCSLFIKEQQKREREKEKKKNQIKRIKKQNFENIKIPNSVLLWAERYKSWYKCIGRFYVHILVIKLIATLQPVTVVSEEIIYQCSTWAKEMLHKRHTNMHTHNKKLMKTKITKAWKIIINLPKQKSIYTYTYIFWCIKLKHTLKSTIFYTKCICFFTCF